MHADLAGIERGGYKLVYADKPNASVSAIQSAIASFPGATPTLDAWFSIGILVGNDGNIQDVRWNSPAAKAKLAPGYKIIAVNGQVFSGDRLRAAIRDAKGKSEPIQITLQSDTFLSTADIDYHDGERYPALERVTGKPAYLDDITKPVVLPRSAQPGSKANNQ
ncbi:MAG: PDZ domain-containing protein [Candidatus Udaeobacter sp.]